MFEFDYGKLKTQMENTLRFMGVPFGEDGIAHNLDAWEYGKEDLVQVLRKHPNWNEDAMAIILDQRDNHAVNEEVVLAGLGLLYNQMGLIGGFQDQRRALLQFPWDLFMSNKMPPEVAEEIAQSDLGQYAAAVPGQKMSRYLRQLFLGMGIPNDDEEFWKIYGQIADALAVYEFDCSLVISVNPSDYLTMSYGDSWTSCHIINPERVPGKSGSTYSGCYKAGCLSYLGDESSIVVYTVPHLPANLADLPITPHHTRQMFYINLWQRSLCQSRLYPYGYDTETIDNRRAVMQQVMATCFGIPNLWIKRNECHGFDTQGLHYADYECEDSGYAISTSRPKFGAENTTETVYIGSMAHCLMCGREITDTAKVLCNDCEEEIDGQDDDFFA